MGGCKLHNAAFAQLWQLDRRSWQANRMCRRSPRSASQRFGEEARGKSWSASVSSGAERRRDWGEIERFDRTIVSVSLAPLPDGATLVTFADVTDRFRIETALRDRNEALDAADRLKSDFVQHASFLFRDPLNAVLGFADMLAAGHAGRAQCQAGRLCAEHPRRLAHACEITSDILDLAMIESGNMRLELGARRSVRAAAPERPRRCGSTPPDSTSLSRSMSRPTSAPAVLDQRRIRQVVFNLLSNAFKYTPRGGAITLGAAHRRRRCARSMSPTTAPASRPDVQANVFDRFEAKGRAGTRAGAGLGLALVNRFVELHDGWVEIETGDGRGTLVRCHLPRRVGETTHARDAQASAGS